MNETQKPQETIGWWHNFLDGLRQTFENVDAEYSEALSEFEAECGGKAREEYEEKYV